MLKSKDDTRTSKDHGKSGGHDLVDPSYYYLGIVNYSNMIFGD